MSDKEVIYNGESVKIFGTDNPDEVLIHFTDNITAYDKIKKAVIIGKGKVNCAIASEIFRILERGGVPTHFIRQSGDCDMICKKASVIDLEVIVRNVIAGSMAHRLGLREGIRPENVIYDLCYNGNTMEDPLINDHHAVALGLVTYDELDFIYGLCKKINDILKPALAGVGLELVDFKVQFGRLPDGSIVLADEITPDGARFWDIDTGERLDKDRFRRDLGKVGDAYREVYKRILSISSGSNEQ